ncbi:MAG: hypothetical protein IKA61_01465 [Clostridia bacterium]|nr:hypothetical protein [Clostridia bacterium]
MTKSKKVKASFLFGLIAVLALCLGIAFGKAPALKAHAETLSAENWTLAIEGDYEFRIQNGNTYWTTYTNSVTTASMLDYTEINGKTLSQINAENPGAITVTLQPAGGTIGSFYRVSINSEAIDMDRLDLGTVVVRAGWSHTDANGTYTIDTDLYFAHKQTTTSQGDTWRYIPKTSVVDISDDIVLQDQGVIATNTRSILLKTTGTDYWGGSTPNEHGGAFLHMLYVNGKSVKQWNNEAHAALNAGDITDITYGSGHGTISGNKGIYAPIFVWNASYEAGVGGCYVQTWIPTGYIDNVSSFKVGKGMGWLTDAGTLYYVAKDVEYVKSSHSFIKVNSSVDITDAFGIIAQDYTSSNGTMLYYLHTNNTQYWTQQYGSTGDYSINEAEWKGVADVSLQGGAVQMSYIEFNGRKLYDINAGDNNAYGATQGNIASGSKYAPILAFLTPQEVGNAIKIMVPSAYPSGSGTAADNHHTITIKQGFYVVDTSTNIKYEVTEDIQWDYEGGAWGKHVNKIETEVTMATMFGSESDAFAGIALEGSDYGVAPSTYAGEVKTALSFAKSTNFITHILVDDVPLPSPGEAFLNVWGNKGYFTFRTGNNTATKLTVLAGCQFPTYNALLTGANEVYVTTEDVTFVKGGDGNWVKDESLKEGEYNTSITTVTYARDNANNWMMFKLSDKDYPDADTNYNIGTTEEQISKLNLYDKIIVDGYSLRSRIAQHGNPIEAPKINLWVADCFAIRVAGAEGSLSGAQTVTIRAGAQFPSYEYITEGVEAYYVTTEEVTFENVGAGGGAWERQYRATFVAEGEVVATIPYLVSQGLVAPEVPEKEGYRGAWESYTANGDITVNAVYTERSMEFAYTNITSVTDQDGFLILTLANSDYQSAPSTWWGPSGSSVKDVLNAMKSMNFHLYGANGNEIGLGGDAIINVWGLTGTLSFYVDGGIGSYSQVSFKKGCEIPSYTQIANGENFCFELIEDVTFVKENGVWVRQGDAMELPGDQVVDSVYDSFDDHYVFSDLYNEGYSSSAVFKDGIQSLVFGQNAYGRLTSKSFTVSFDFMYTEAVMYDGLEVKLGTDGHGGNEAHFGWRFFFLRQNQDGSTTQNYCVQFFSGSATESQGDADGDGNIAAPAVGSQAFVQGQTYSVTIGYKLVDPTNGVVTVFAEIDGLSTGLLTYTLKGDFITFCQKTNQLIFGVSNASKAVVGDVGKNLNQSTSAPNKVVLDGVKGSEDIYSDSIILPELDPIENNQIGKVFVGWTTDINNISNLYSAGYEFTVSGDVTLYPVYVGFMMDDGAGVRLNNGTGIRFTVLVDGASYDKLSGKILETGTILAPTSYLKDKQLTHELGNGYFIATVVKTWAIAEGANRKYAMAYTGISAEQYSRAFSARGYLKINYDDGVGYIYTDYSEENNSRSMYQVATMAKEAGEASTTLNSYVNDVADLTVQANLDVAKTTVALGNYAISSVTKNGNTVTVTFSKAVKAAIINGERVVMGYDSAVLVDGLSYNVSNYKLSNDGLTLVFTLTQKEVTLSRIQYLKQLNKYLSRTDYTDLHFAHVKSLVETAVSTINGSEDANVWKTTFETTVATIERVKNAVQNQANEGEIVLDAPVLGKGLGYTVTWNAVANADYYTIYDDNDYREEVVVMASEALVYEAEVVGNHNISVVAHSYYEEYKASANSNVVATPEVKQVFTYKAMLDGLYKFSSDQMSTMGISTTGCYFDSSDKKYFVYYNKETGWSPYAIDRTDWTSPQEFPAHAQRLKDMGNNVILVAFDTTASYKADDTWETSRLKYVMDTAWSIGMKVLVCDEVLYKLSISESDADGAATSKDEVLTAINNRQGFEDYVTHPAFYGFSLDDEPHSSYISGALAYTIQALQEKCSALGVQPFYLSCLYQADGGGVSGTLESYYEKWFDIDGDGNNYIDYLYVDIYTKHAMGQPTDRYNNSYKVIYGDSFLGNKSNNYKFYQAITAHTQNTDYIVTVKQGVLLEEDMYMSLLYAAAHDVAGYSWFCYFPITGETSGSMVGFDGNGYGNGIGNSAMTGYSYYNAAKIAGYQFELIQGLLDGYEWTERTLSGNKLTTKLSNGSRTATFYVNADVTEMSNNVTFTGISGSEFYLVGYGVGTESQPYEVKTNVTEITLSPGQALICIS